ncbi:MAG: S4 domain-containing protein [Paracoccus sp. (in: a-proteobacteria)]
MARAGVASRREAERMILEGRVTVNGQKIDSPALDVSPSDKIRVDGKPWTSRRRPGFGCITSRSGW